MLFLLCLDRKKVLLSRFYCKVVSVYYLFVFLFVFCCLSFGSFVESLICLHFVTVCCVVVGVYGKLLVSDAVYFLLTIELYSGFRILDSVVRWSILLGFNVNCGDIGMWFEVYAVLLNRIYLICLLVYFEFKANLMYKWEHVVYD